MGLNIYNRCRWLPWAMSTSVIRRSFRLIQTLRTARCFSTKDNSGQMFEDDPQYGSGKTTVTFLNKEDDAVYIEAFSCQGFRLGNGFRVIGPTAFFPKSVLHWNVKDASQINEESLSLFTVLEPKLDLLVIGVGDISDMSRVSPDLKRAMWAKKINVEILSTHQALATFNFLNSEKRCVAGAMIPPHFLDAMNDEDVYTSKTYSGLNPMTMRRDYHEEQLEGGELEGLMPKDISKNLDAWAQRRKQQEEIKIAEREERNKPK